MPTYDWRCERCGATAETWSARMERGTPPEHCGTAMAVRIAPAALLFKGGGWGGKP